MPYNTSYINPRKRLSKTKCYKFRDEGTWQYTTWKPDMLLAKDKKAGKYPDKASDDNKDKMIHETAALLRLSAVYAQCRRTKGTAHNDSVEDMIVN